MPIVYKFLEARWALDDIIRRRIKLSEIADMNDPMELMSVQVTAPMDSLDMRRAVTEMSGNVGALCFCRGHESVLLWAHYADKHRGICLGFEAPSEHVESVSYIEEPITVSKASDLTPALARQWMFSKFTPWSYEDEARIYARLNDRVGEFCYVDFSQGLRLREVILGMRCQTSVSEVLAAIASYAEPPVVRRARLCFNPVRIIVGQALSADDSGRASPGEAENQDPSREQAD